MAKSTARAGTTPADEEGTAEAVASAPAVAEGEERFKVVSAAKKGHEWEHEGHLVPPGAEVMVTRDQRDRLIKAGLAEPAA